jgi:hypothetical protein
MPKWTVTIAANVRAYATVEIEADDEDAAWQRAKDIVSAPAMWSEPEMADDVFFVPEYDTLDDFELLDDLRLET